MIRQRRLLLAALTTSLLLVPPGLAQTFPRDDHQAQIQHWVGGYRGYNDGREARLTIDIDQPGGDTHVFIVTLKDLDRGVVFRGTGVSSPGIEGEDAIGPHVMLFPFGPLRQVEGAAIKEIGALYLHTWNTNYISGHTVWNEKTYGLAF